MMKSMYKSRSLDDSLARRVARRTTLGVLAVLTTLGLGVAGATAASAAWQDCQIETGCTWPDRDYAANAIHSKTANRQSGPLNGSLNVASSASNNHDLCMRATYYVDNFQTGRYFWLYSYQNGSGGYRDPYLTNGAGYGPYSTENFNDDLGSIGFSDC